MFITFTLPQNSDNEGHKIVNDVFGIGKVADFLGKIVDKLPIDKFPVGLTFVLVVYIIVVFLYFGLLFSNNPKVANFPYNQIGIAIMIFGVILSIPFAIIEISKHAKDKD